LKLPQYTVNAIDHRPPGRGDVRTLALIPPLHPHQQVLELAQRAVETVQAEVDVAGRGCDLGGGLLEPAA
jgi:hypothetical protein